MAAAESYPDGLLYHHEHDWALIEGDEAVLGITWFAQDALGRRIEYFVSEARNETRREYGNVVGRNIYGKSVFAVFEMNLHLSSV